MGNGSYEAQQILVWLQTLHDELEAISDAGDRLKYSRSPEVIDFKYRLRQAKETLKQAAKYETIDYVRREPSDLERAFYAPAVRSASAHFSMRVDAPPSRWVAGLSDTVSDLSYAIYGLKAYIASS